jgi:hypothetical protein
MSPTRGASVRLIRIEMLSIPILFDSAHPRRLHHQPARGDDDCGTGQSQVGRILCALQRTREMRGIAGGRRRGIGDRLGDFV